MNGNETHTILEFDVGVESGFKLNKERRNIIYVPIRSESRHFIDNITVRIFGDNRHLIVFQGEKTILKLELKEF